MQQNKYFLDGICTLKSWLKIKSVKTDAEEGYPFGANIGKMLEKALIDAKTLGFETINHDNYIGEVVFGEGSDKEGLAILCHLDVVPEGDEKAWSFPPYSAVVDNGRIYGRGVVDDKAPAVLCLYALKELKDSGFIPKRKIKLILGCDEESGWGCIAHYNKVATLPNQGFSPDGDFPVIYAEKGILHVEFLFDKNKQILDINGGDRVNKVCDFASVTLVDGKDFNLIDNVYYNDDKICAKGISAHGSTPQKGDNAIKKILLFLTENGLFNKKDYLNLFDNQNLFSSFKDQTGSLTFSPNVISVKSDKISVKVDIRHPSTFDKKEVENTLFKIGKFKVINYQAPLFVDKENQLVKTLLAVYKRITKKSGNPIAIGGGTYARALKCGVAFGPSDIDDNMCHVVDENAKIEDLEKWYKIYLEGIKELCK